MLKILFTSVLLSLSAQVHAASPVPPAPRYYVYDEPGLLTSQQKKALESILIEHDDTTGEQIVVAIFKGLNGQGAFERTHQIFEEWQIGKRGRDNGALLALYETERLGQLDSGYGLQSLDEAKNRAILRDFLLPELSAEHPYRAIGLSVLEILRAAESPLIESGRAQQLLQAGGLDGSFKPASRSWGPGSWLIFVLAGALLFGFVLSSVLAAEAHFTGEGWFRPRLFALSWPWAGTSRHKQTASTQLGGADGNW